MYGNVLKGIINTLAAKEAGVSDETNNNPSKQGTDDGGNKYYTSWMRVVETMATTGSTLGKNQIRVILYGDNEVPAQRNFEPCELMTLARWGCINYGDPDDATLQASIARRQRVFMISTSDGRVIKYNGVDRPILQNWNYGVTIGELPEFVKNYTEVRKILDVVGEHTDWVYAQGIVVENYVKVSREGKPVSVTVYCGDWIDANPTTPVTLTVWDEATQTNIQLSYPIPAAEYEKNDSPYIGHGIYFYNKYNAQQYETHEVRHIGGRWQCLQSQPVKSGNTYTFNEPRWDSSYWRLVDGNDNLSIEFVSSRGLSFRRGFVDTIITPHLFYGNVDISADVAAENWDWTRESESGKTVADETWDAQHEGMRMIHLGNEDMPATWSSQDKAIFTCTVTVDDGKSTRIVQNQIRRIWEEDLIYQHRPSSIRSLYRWTSRSTSRPVVSLSSGTTTIRASSPLTAAWLRLRLRRIYPYSTVTRQRAILLRSIPFVGTRTPITHRQVLTSRRKSSTRQTVQRQTT